MEMDIKSLVSQIQTLDGNLKNEANKAVNTLLTIRNWLIGYYLVEYEQKGQDRAKYGDRILQTVADSIGSDGFSFRNLKLFRQFFLAYPRISESAREKIANFLSIGQTPPANSNYIIRICKLGRRRLPNCKVLVMNHLKTCQ